MPSKNTLAKKLHLNPAELFMLTIAISALLVDLCLIVYKDAQVDYAGYSGIAITVTCLVAIGYFYRLSKRSENIASGLLCAAIFVFFSACLSMYNYLLLPLSRPLIDVPLAEIDALFGFHWPDVMAFAAQYPTIVWGMKIAYLSTMPQFALLIVILGLGGHNRELHIMLVSVTITATLTICFWGAFPTLGAKTMYEIPHEIWAAINPPVNKQYALDLITIAREGAGTITPSEIRGLIAFPSYHVVLALTAMYAARNIKYIAPIYFTINMIILPGIFIHGGHHFMDLPAGFIMFIFGTYMATRFINHNGTQPSNSQLPAPQSKPQIATI